MYNHIPIWVIFPRLPLGYLSVRSLSKLASAIGIPLYIHGFTENVGKISYARVLIVMDLAKRLSDVIVVETPSGPWDRYTE